MRRRRVMVLSCTLGMAIAASEQLVAQQILEGSNSSLSIELTSASSILEDPLEYVVEVDTQFEVPPPKAATILPTTKERADEGSELVQQLYPSGTPHIAKHVALDAQGNYVNHGEYQEWSESGELLINGQYAMGKQQGLWVQFCNAKASKLFESEPYKKFKAPFQSTAEFADGKLNGLWSITDKDGKKVSEIQLVAGKRHGAAVWYYPSGTVLWQSEYKDGLLHGSFVEKDATGKVIRQTQYQQGQKAEKSQQYHANKKTKAQYQILTATQILITPDDWSSSALAVYEAKGEEVKHGEFVTYYENGSTRSQTAYKNGIQEGEFLSWYPNNQRETVGSYLNGRQHGKWSWWHENGMRKSLATYENGTLVGTVLAWNDQGIRVNAGEMVNSESNSVPKSEEIKSSRSASSVRRPGRK